MRVVFEMGNNVIKPASCRKGMLESILLIIGISICVGFKIWELIRIWEFIKNRKER